MRWIENIDEVKEMHVAQLYVELFDNNRGLLTST